MSVFKAVGKFVKVMEGGTTREIWGKLFFRADDEQQVRVLATESGMVEASVSFYSENYSSDLGNITAYSADNNCGVLPGC